MRRIVIHRHLTHQTSHVRTVGPRHHPAVQAHSSGAAHAAINPVCGSSAATYTLSLHAVCLPTVSRRCVADVRSENCRRSRRQQDFVVEDYRRGERKSYSRSISSRRTASDKWLQRTFETRSFISSERSRASFVTTGHCVATWSLRNEANLSAFTEASYRRTPLSEKH